MSIAIHGLGISVGVNIAIGRVLKLSQGLVRAEPVMLASGDISAEVARFHQAVETAALQLREIRNEIPDDTPDDILEFIDAHLLMLEDKALSEGPAELIQNEGCSAEWALQLRRDQLVSIFDHMEDVYLRTRKDDLDHVVNRIMNVLQGDKYKLPQETQGRIVVAEDMTPADIIMLHHRGIAGFITEFGSPMSHTAILARSLKIPAVVGAHGAFNYLQSGETIVLDATHGAVLADCGTTTLDYFHHLLEQEFHQQQAPAALRYLPAITRDQHKITLQANIELAEDIHHVIETGSNGVGLYRTEFLYMNREDLPTEEEHFETYLQVVNALRGLPITIRTLDLGADKQCEYNPEPAACTNPALGLRAIRLCLKETDIFRTQLRAILRVSAFGQVRILLPMLTNLWEAHHARGIISDELHCLQDQGIAVDAKIQVGSMIETPAAAITAAAFTEVFDFLSIGTNDLIQYTLAVDRSDDAVNYLYDPLHPAVLTLIQSIVQAGKDHHTPVAMCGEMAGDTKFIPLLLGMGLQTLSMQASALPDAKRMIRGLDLEQLHKRVQKLLARLHRINIETEVEKLI